MRIELNRVLPIPLVDTPLAENSCWRTETLLETEERFLVEAPSGTGKTTLISILYGIRHDYEGTVLLEGKDIRKLTADDWSELRQKTFSIVFQDLRLFHQMTALENIQVKNQLANTLSETEIRQMAEELGIAHRLDSPCGKLSLGQQQRVAIIRALAQPFHFLLLDEPFSHLDEVNTQKACAMIERACAKNGAGLILTSLGANRLFNYSGRIII